MIETERLILRGWRDSDVAPFHAMCNDPEVMRYLGAPLSREDAEAAAARQNGFVASHGYCFWAVERNRTMRMVLGVERPIFQPQPHLTAFFPFFHEHSAEDDDLVAILLRRSGQRGERDSLLGLFDELGGE